jgi:hypothetical protein
MELICECYLINYWWKFYIIIFILLAFEYYKINIEKL